MSAFTEELMLFGEGVLTLWFRLVWDKCNCVGFCLGAGMCELCQGWDSGPGMLCCFGLLFKD